MTYFYFIVPSALRVPTAVCLSRPRIVDRTVTRGRRHPIGPRFGSQAASLVSGSGAWPQQHTPCTRWLSALQSHGHRVSESHKHTHTGHAHIQTAVRAHTYAAYHRRTARRTRTHTTHTDARSRTKIQRRIAQLAADPVVISHILVSHRVPYSLSLSNAETHTDMSTWRLWRSNLWITIIITTTTTMKIRAIFSSCADVRRIIVLDTIESLSAM